MVDIKICGLRDLAALEAALSEIDPHETRYVGFVFFEKSPRNVSLSEAKSLVDALDGRAKSVALLVDPTDDVIDDVVQHVTPDFLQLHGQECPDRVAQIRKRSGKAIIKAVGVRNGEDVQAGCRYYAPGKLADLLIFDAKPPKDAPLPGGNGLTFDWRILTSEEGGALSVPFLLSGGLTPENVSIGIEKTKPTGVDVSSGVERAPGQKDPELISQFIRATKAKSP